MHSIFSSLFCTVMVVITHAYLPCTAISSNILLHHRTMLSWEEECHLDIFNYMILLVQAWNNLAPERQFVCASECIHVPYMYVFMAQVCKRSVYVSIWAKDCLGQCRKRCRKKKHEAAQGNVERGWLRKMRGDVGGFAGSLSTIEVVSQHFFFFFAHTGTRSNPSNIFSRGRTLQTLQSMFQHCRVVGVNEWINHSFDWISQTRFIISKLSGTEKMFL